jgi:Double zinc ribbon
MDERTSCPVCRHDNPPENRFCGSCGTALADSGQLVPHRGYIPAATVRALPAKLGPTGKALAVGLAALAAEAGLLWLRRRVERADRTPLPAAQDPKSAVPDYLLSQSLEEAYVWLQEGYYRSHIFARREVRSFDALKPPDGRG